jgi:hypothetical protein
VVKGEIEMKAELKGKDLVVTIPLLEKPTPSKSGKTLLVFSSRGVRPLSVEINGKPVYAALNGFIYPDAPTSVTRNMKEETPEEDGDGE